ncbi:MAG: radical SAM protein [Candidatus Omnitrophica bacterium]|nr:radical SAM protein [Candidatus Omnitrophota bacterium]
MKNTEFKILLLIPPAFNTGHPPLSTPSLLAFLRAQGIDAHQDDLDHKYYNYIINNKLDHIVTEQYRNEKIRDKVYYYKDIQYRNQNSFSEPVDPVLGARFDFTEKLLSSHNLFRYIDDEEENTFKAFFKREILERIKDDKYDMVGISITAPSQVISAFTFGRVIKSEIPQIKVVVGGQWITLFKEELIKRSDFGEFYDYMIYSEGETPLVSLINAIKRNTPLSNVPNLIFKRNDTFVPSNVRSKEDIDALPCPDFEGIPLEHHKNVEGKLSLTYETSRGCYWDKCIFCVDLPLPKVPYREKNIELVIRDIKELKERHNCYGVLISNAVLSPRQMEEFSNALIRENIKIAWSSFSRLEDSITKDILRLIKKAGCFELVCGLESMNQRVLNFCKKGIRTNVAKRILKDASDVGLKICCQVMIGLPSETIDEALDTVCSLVEYPNVQPIINVYYLTPNNAVFNDPEQYGIRYAYDGELPFRFIYPFTHSLGTISRDDVDKLIKINGMLPRRSSI